MTPFYERAISAVAHAAELEPAEILSASRKPAPTRARWAVMIALRERGVSFQGIGDRLGRRDHKTVMYGIVQGNYLARRSSGFAALVDVARAA